MAIASQPPSGGCVLKPEVINDETVAAYNQPPSGGCVLKQAYIVQSIKELTPAAFGRLCVETCQSSIDCLKTVPAAFGRLCVETGRKRL